MLTNKTRIYVLVMNNRSLKLCKSRAYLMSISHTLNNHTQLDSGVEWVAQLPLIQRLGQLCFSLSRQSAWSGSWLAEELKRNWNVSQTTSEIQCLESTVRLPKWVEFIEVDNSVSKVSTFT